MNLIVGLGNPGKKYEKTLHNVGFILLDNLARENNLKWSKNLKASALVALYGNYLLVKPQTYMNKSGISVAYLMSFYKLNPSDLLVVHDDMDLQFGQTKLQRGAGSAGHLGVESVIVSLKTKDFFRFRVGVGRPKDQNISAEDWVLSDFTPQQLEEIQNISFPISG